jgi:acetolactate synthase regulatory subunit
VLQEVERRTKEVCERDPEANPDAVRPHVEMLVKNERRQKALEAEGAEAPDYDTGSQEVRRGRRRG